MATATCTAGTVRMPSLARPTITVVATDRVSRRRPSPAVLMRRRLAAGFLASVLGLAAVAVVAQAGDAFGGASLAASGRDPASAVQAQEVVVRVGDSLWSIAQRLAPGADPRPLVDALARSRAGAPLVPGETISLPVHR